MRKFLRWRASSSSHFRFFTNAFNFLKKGRKTWIKMLSSSAVFLNSSAGFKLGLRREHNVGLFPRRARSQAIHALANTNVSPHKRSSNKEVIMVDPLEAKRLATKQMERIKAREKFRKQRQIEAINGAWAMIGLSAGIVIEGQTGEDIPTQLVGYWAAFLHLFASQVPVSSWSTAVNFDFQGVMEIIRSLTVG